MELDLLQIKSTENILNNIVEQNYQIYNYLIFEYLLIFEYYINYLILILFLID